MVRSTLRSLWLFVRSPSAFFRKHDPASTLPAAAGAVFVLAVALVVAVLVIASLLAGAVDGTVTMDNPDRPPEWVCDQHGDGPDSTMGVGCDEPETIERDAGSLVYEAMTDYLIFAAIAPFVMWFLGGIVLFGAARLAAGSPSGAGAFALAGWAAVPELIRAVVGVVALSYALSDVTIADFEQSVAVFEAALAPVEPVLALVSVIATVWQWRLFTAGFVQDANLSRAAAATATGIPLAIVLIAGLS